MVGWLWLSWGGVRISSTPLRYIWDYWEPSAVHSLPGDSAIISVALCPARSEAFDEAPEFLLVMATELHGWMVFLMVFVGLCHQTIGIFSFFWMWILSRRDWEDFKDLLRSFQHFIYFMFPQKTMSGHPPLRNPGGSQRCLERQQVAAEDLGIFGADGWRVFPFHSIHRGWAHLSALGGSTDLWAVLRLRRLVQVQVSTAAALCGTRRDRGKWGPMRNEHRRILHAFTWTSAGLIGGFTYCHVQPYLRRWSLRILKE